MNEKEGKPVWRAYQSQLGVELSSCNPGCSDNSLETLGWEWRHWSLSKSHRTELGETNHGGETCQTIAEKLIVRTKETTITGEYGGRTESTVSFMMCGFHYMRNYSMRIQNERVVVQLRCAFLGKGQFLWVKEKRDASGLYEFRIRLRQALF